LQYIFAYYKYIIKSSTSHMKNISFLLMVVAIASILVAGITSTTMQADAFKSTSSHKNGINVCYQSENCKQSNVGQQVYGKNNKLIGFNDQSTN
jgi:hypothetical protein